MFLASSMVLFLIRLWAVAVFWLVALVSILSHSVLAEDSEPDALEIERRRVLTVLDHTCYFPSLSTQLI